MVEDNEGDVLLTQLALKDAKFAVDMAVVGDGVEAMDYLRKKGKFADVHRPDLILLDLNLPRMDGREVLAAVKADPELGKIPVVVLTSSSADADVERVYGLHANCYVVKPVGAKEFEKIVKSINEFWLTIVKLPNGA
jgi:two-component system response regulator